MASNDHTRRDFVFGVVHEILSDSDLGVVVFDKGLRHGTHECFALLEDLPKCEVGDIVLFRLTVDDKHILWALPPIHRCDTGTLRFLSKKKRFGFITPLGGGEQVFADVRDSPDLEVCDGGEIDAYWAQYDDRKGKYKAAYVHIVVE